jgi:hypothetical protein
MRETGEQMPATTNRQDGVSGRAPKPVPWWSLADHLLAFARPRDENVVWALLERAARKTVLRNSILWTLPLVFAVMSLGCAMISLGCAMSLGDIPLIVWLFSSLAALSSVCDRILFSDSLWQFVASLELRTLLFLLPAIWSCYWAGIRYGGKRVLIGCIVLVLLSWIETPYYPKVIRFRPIELEMSDFGFLILLVPGIAGFRQVKKRYPDILREQLEIEAPAPWWSLADHLLAFARPRDENVVWTLVERAARKTVLRNSVLWMLPFGCAVMPLVCAMKPYRDPLYSVFVSLIGFGFLAPGVFFATRMKSAGLGRDLLQTPLPASMYHEAFRRYLRIPLIVSLFSSLAALPWFAVGWIVQCGSTFEDYILSQYFWPFVAVTELRSLPFLLLGIWSCYWAGIRYGGKKVLIGCIILVLLGRIMPLTSTGFCWVPIEFRKYDLGFLILLVPGIVGFRGVKKRYPEILRAQLGDE